MTVSFMVTVGNVNNQNHQSPFVQHDGKPDQVHGAAQSSSAKLGKSERKLGSPSQNQELKIRRMLTKLKTPQVVNLQRLKTGVGASTKLGQITNPERPCKMRTNHMIQIQGPPKLAQA